MTWSVTAAKLPHPHSSPAATYKNMTIQTPLKLSSQRTVQPPSIQRSTGETTRDTSSARHLVSRDPAIVVSREDSPDYNDLLRHYDELPAGRAHKLVLNRTNKLAFRAYRNTHIRKGIVSCIRIDVTQHDVTLNLPLRGFLSFSVGEPAE